MTAISTETRIQRLLPWIYAVLLHGAFLVLLILSIHWSNSTVPSLGGHGSTTEPVQATVVDRSVIRQQMAILEAQARKKHEAQQRLLQQAAAAKAERVQEEQKVATLKQQQKAAQHALDQRLADLRQQAQAEQAEQAKVAALKAEEARAAKLAKVRESAVADRRRVELAREIRVEERARDARRASLLQQYAALIAEKVEQNWIQPAAAPANLRCTVHVEQVRGGTVANVQVQSCNGDDAVRQSIVTAVYRSSPLPSPGDPSLFHRDLDFTFCPGCNAGG